MLLLVLLCIPTTTSLRHKILSRHYLVELYETNPNATTEFIDSFHTLFDIHRIISHRFLQAVSIEMKDNLTISSLHTHLTVKSISPIQIIHRADSTPALHNLTPVQVGLVSPHRLSQVDKIHHELKLTGQGIFIGLIDTGVDYYHPALGGGFGPGFKVVAGYDFVGDHWNSSDSNSKPKPDNDPLDNCDKSSGATGHGTHVAGIIAGFDEENNFTGVAPLAKLGMWRVFSCQGSARSDVVLAAILMAFDAGVDIISMSLGSDMPWSAPHNIQTKLISKISASGVSVVISAGNTGAKGAFTTSTPGNVVPAFEVASVNNAYNLFDGSFTVTGIPNPLGFNFVLGSNSTMEDEYLAISYNGKGSLESDACHPEFISNHIQGKIALVKRGACSFSTKVTHLASKGAIGAIVYDNIDEPPTAIRLSNATIPVYVISLQDGQFLFHNSKNSQTFFLKFSIHTVLLKSKYAGTVSAFSSVGPTAELDFKPNIAAVGQLVYSTLPSYLGSWGIKQGTSMACPYVAGSIALYLEYHGKNKTSRNQVHQKFQNFALATSIDNNTSGYLDTPLIQGAGIIQVYDTILETTHVTPSEISFNDTFTTDYRIKNLTITNYGLDSVCYGIFNNVSVSLSSYNRSALGYAYLGSTLKTFNYAKLEFSADQVFLLAGQSQTIQVSVHVPDTDPKDHIMYGGFIQFKSYNHTKDLHVPYFGIVGSQRELPIIDKDGCKIQNNATNTTYDISGSIVYDLTSSHRNPVLIHLKLLAPTLVLKGELLNETRNILGYAFPPLAYLQRDFVNDTSPRSPVVWSGQYFKTIPYDVLAYSEENIPEVPQELYIKVKPGNYSIKISALKQFGDMKNEQDWESFIIGPLIVI
ncbi:hypothetical protein HPULCUR_006065 [Helicostylum pulchrum]|uniref:Uncharacterized protein n=1 Tax=Helicostylum pulchrum TaxID=562976 RepID=A0ABP9Y0U7_9FUNG